MQGIQKSVNSAYDSAKGSYEGERDTYNTKLAEEKKRLADVFTAGFDAPIKVPARPCAPTRPGAYSGPQFRQTETAD